jgi:hypothetical protein
VVFFLMRTFGRIALLGIGRDWRVAPFSWHDLFERFLLQRWRPRLDASAAQNRNPDPRRKRCVALWDWGLTAQPLEARRVPARLGKGLTR